MQFLAFEAKVGLPHWMSKPFLSDQLSNTKKEQLTGLFYEFRGFGVLFNPE